MTNLLDASAAFLGMAHNSLCRPETYLDRIGRNRSCAFHSYHAMLATRVALPTQLKTSFYPILPTVLYEAKAEGYSSWVCYPGREY